jgi:anaerobic C4-dicarboxylate transporter DcuB
LCCRPVRYGYYILPTYPSDLATIQFDRSGTTHIGRYSRLIGVGSACVAGWLLALARGPI